MSLALVSALLRREEEEFDGNLCTFETCDLVDSYYGYRPSLIANVVLTALFGISCAAFFLQAFKSKQFIGFSVAMTLGTVGETLGYVGRILMHNNPWKEIPFMIQICCLTVAPAFLAAGIYFCLSRIVTTFGRENSRIPAVWYPRIFITCDVIALILQAAGGGIASSADPGDSSADLGKNLMIAGVVFQVVTLGIFIVLASDFAIRTWLRIRSLGAGALDAKYARLRDSTAFRSFLLALAISTLFIFVRCVYRIAELSGGWDGPLMKEEPLFIALEGGMVSAAVLVLNAFHPGRCFGQGYSDYSKADVASNASYSEQELRMLPRQSSP
ncbi:hypothetical protein FQN55_007843 [Onygenales sp. PD_40]|nr:hypothetical protein FQN55_007843 [Onygenales sp. PD_40]KAK2783647.1 hypothetical protein FQN53_009099 [Emmonsiellopsis sp. PD_33]